MAQFYIKEVCNRNNVILSGFKVYFTNLSIIISSLWDFGTFIMEMILTTKADLDKVGFC